MSNAEKKNKVNQLFTLFQAGEWDESASLFSDDARITRQYGDRITTNTVTEFIHSLKSGPLAKVGIPEYRDRKVSLLEEGGFVERHKTRLTIKDQLIEIPVCIIGTFNMEGKISSIEEYLDPSPIIKVLTRS